MHQENNINFILSIPNAIALSMLSSYCNACRPIFLVPYVTIDFIEKGRSIEKITLLGGRVVFFDLPLKFSLYLTKL